MNDVSPAPSPLARIREIALLLPEVEERSDEGQPTFLVGDAPFVQVRDGGADVRVRTGDAPIDPADAASDSGWTTVTLGVDPDWTLIEDRVARSWELAAPRRLLEAGGR